MLDEFYFADPRLTLVPIEHLTPKGIAGGFAEVLRERRGWAGERIAMLNASFHLYWKRMEALASRSRYLSPPRLRNLGVIADGLSVRPYAQILNTSTWTLYECDLDPTTSHPELLAYLLAHGDRMTEAGEVTLVAVHLAPWWFERSADERDAFCRAATASARPDADTFRAIGEALPWLREIRHETLRPPRQARGHRPIPGTGLLVPRAIEHEPDRLVARCRDVATATLSHFYGRWQAPDDGSAAALCAWLETEAPPLLVTGRAGGVLWDPQRPEHVDMLRRELAPAPPRALGEIAADLRIVATHTRTFLAALTDPDALPPPDPHSAQSGYAYMHRERRLVAYNLHESGIERLAGPALPYARAMLGARVLHEWAHLAVEAGHVPCTLDAARWAELVGHFAVLLDEVIARAPRAVRERAAPDVRSLERTGSAGAALVAIFTTRLPDFQANLLASPFLSVVERETYVRQNIRPLGREFAAAQIWRLLVRYLYEFQYLAFSEVSDPRAYFFASTGFANEFFASGALDEERFDTLAAAARALCDAHVVDEGRLRRTA